MSFDKKYMPWSFTKLNALKCPRYFLKRYIEKAPYEFEPEEFKKGIEAHDIAEMILKGEYEDDYIPFPENVYFTLNKIKKYAENKKIETEKDFYSDEELLNFFPEKPENCGFMGKVDVLIRDENELVIYDLKNRYDPMISEQDLFQLKTYAFLNWDGEKKIRVGIIALKNNIEPLREKEISFDEIVDFEVKIRTMIKKAEKRLKEYEKTGFIPIPNVVNCIYCYYKLSCPVSDEFKGENKNEIFKKIFILTLQLEDLKKQAKEYVKKNGKIILDDVGIEFDLYPVYKTEVDEYSFREICFKLGLNPNDFLKYDTEKIKNLAKRRGFEELINALQFEIKHFSFSFKKVKENE